MKSPGERLWERMNALLAANARELNTTLEWSETERDTLERAAATADRRAELQEAYDIERAGEGRPTMLVKLSSEMRALDSLVVVLIGKVSPDLSPAKDPNKVRAGRARWARQLAVG